MIELYYWTTPNGHKITLFLEETKLPYRIVPVNIGKGEQFAADFLRISPNNRIPAIVDLDPEDGAGALSIFESGAILLYLADREFIAGEYSIADMACYPWIVPHQRQRQNLADFPNLQRWFDTIRERPATRRAYAIADEINVTPVVSEEAKRILFGQDASTVKVGN